MCVCVFVWLYGFTTELCMGLHLTRRRASVFNVSDCVWEGCTDQRNSFAIPLQSALLLQVMAFRMMSRFLWAQAYPQDCDAMISEAADWCLHTF